MTRFTRTGAGRRATRWGFTLVELLVVIGIIALLISILLPTLSQARDSAKTIAGLSNQRQIGQGIMFYQNDWDLGIPAHEVLDGLNPDGQYQSGRFWAWKLAGPGYIPGGEADEFGAESADTVFMCPAGENQNNRFDDWGPAGGAAGPWTAPASQIDRRGAMFFEMDVPSQSGNTGDPYHIRINYATNGSWDSGIAWWEDQAAAASGNPIDGSQPNPWARTANFFPMSYVNTDRTNLGAYGATTWKKVTEIGDSTRVPLIFDGPFLLGSNMNMINMRHKNQDAFNAVFADGHAATVDSATVPNHLHPNSDWYTDVNDPYGPFYNVLWLNSNEMGVKWTIKQGAVPWLPNFGLD